MAESAAGHEWRGDDGRVDVWGVGVVAFDCDCRFGVEGLLSCGGGGDDDGCADGGVGEFYGVGGVGG